MSGMNDQQSENIGATAETVNIKISFVFGEIIVNLKYI